MDGSRILYDICSVTALPAGKKGPSRRQSAPSREAAPGQREGSRPHPARYIHR